MSEIKISRTMRSALFTAVTSPRGVLIVSARTAQALAQRGLATRSGEGAPWRITARGCALLDPAERAAWIEALHSEALAEQAEREAEAERIESTRREVHRARSEFCAYPTRFHNHGDCRRAAREVATTGDCAVCDKPGAPRMGSAYEHTDCAWLVTAQLRRVPALSVAQARALVRDRLALEADTASKADNLGRARRIAADKYPAGTPEHAAYAAKLRVALDRADALVAGETAGYRVVASGAVEPWQHIATGSRTLCGILTGEPGVPLDASLVDCLSCLDAYTIATKTCQTH